VWVAGLLVPVLPSPKFHEYEYGVVPPETVAVNVTCWLVLGDVGLNVKSAVSVSGVTVTEWLAVAVLPFVSVTVSVTMNVPLVE